VHLPNGFVLRYPALRASPSSYEYIGDSRNFKKFLKQRVTQGNEEITYTKIYGGKMTENIVQALAAQIIREQMAAVAAKGLRVVLQVHDEIVVSTPEKQAKETLDIMLTQMSQPPRWAPDLPLACEGGYASNYGDT
jgi:DNA polymerase